MSGPSQLPVEPARGLPRCEEHRVRGGELAFQDVYESHRPGVLRYLERLVGPNDAEDLEQEVFVRVSRALERFRGDSKVSTWVYRIATRVAIDALRKRRPCEQNALPRYPAVSTAGVKLEEVEARNLWTGEKAPSIEAGAIRTEMGRCIREQMGVLPPHYQEVLALSELEGLADREIAEVLGLEVGVVKIRLHRARAKLRWRLQTHCRLGHDERGVLACEPAGNPASRPTGA